MRSPALLFLRAVIVRDWRFLAVTIVSCSVAATVAAFQYSVFTSFLSAGAVIPRSVGADFWIVARSVECFDFPNNFDEDYAATLTRYVPGARFRRVLFGFAPWRSPTGRRGNVALVGIDGSNLPETGFAADRSDLARLDIASVRYVEGSIGDTTLHLSRIKDDLATFLGAPYVVVPFETARRILRTDTSATSFVVGNFGPGKRPDLDRAQSGADQRFPEVSLISAHAFEASSSAYWQRKTGAGAAILLAAVLAGLLMVILLTNGIARFVQRYDQDLLSLIGHGAGTREIATVIALAATLVATVTAGVALVITPLVIALTTPLLPWVAFRIGDMVLPLAAVIGALFAAVASARGAIASYGPEAVFRS